MNKALGNFPDGPVVKNSPSNAGDTGLVPGWGTKIPQATWYSHNNNIKRNEKKSFQQPKMLTTDSFMNQTNKLNAIKK